MTAKFKLRDPTKKHIVEWPVTVTMPVDGGDFQESTFTAKFEVIPMEEVDKIYDKARQEMLGDKADDKKAAAGLQHLFGQLAKDTLMPGDVELLKRGWVGWTDVANEDKDSAAKFTPKVRDALLGTECFALSMKEEYLAFLKGRRRAGN